jgi:hypothetical protein
MISRHVQATLSQAGRNFGMNQWFCVRKI